MHPFLCRRLSQLATHFRRNCANELHCRRLDRRHRFVHEMYYRARFDFDCIMCALTAMNSFALAVLISTFSVLFIYFLCLLVTRVSLVFRAIIFGPLFAMRITFSISLCWISSVLPILPNNVHQYVVATIVPHIIFLGRSGRWSCYMRVSTTYFSFFSFLPSLHKSSVCVCTAMNLYIIV